MYLSIIIPTLNEKTNIERLIPFLLENSDNKEVEIIVMDAIKSTDGTAEIAIKLGAKSVSCENCGRAAQMNLGATLAKASILYFVHADVLPPKTYLADIKRAIENGIDYGCFSYQFDSPSKLLQANAYFTRYDGLFAGGGDQTLFIKKSMFESLGGFSMDWCIMEDFELTKRAKKKGFSYKIIPNNALVSARKYEKNSYLRVNLVNLLVFIMFWFGSSPQQIKRIYKRLLA